MEALFIEITDAYPLLGEGDVSGRLLRLSRFDWCDYEKSLAGWVALAETMLVNVGSVSLVGISKCATLAITLGNFLANRHPGIRVSVFASSPITKFVMDEFFRKQVSPWLAARFSVPRAWERFAVHVDLLSSLPSRSENLEIVVIFSWSAEWMYDLEQSERLRVLPYARFEKIDPSDFRRFLPSAGKFDFHTRCLEAYRFLHPEKYRRFLASEPPRKILLIANRPVGADDRDISEDVDSCDMVIRVSRMTAMHTGKTGSRIDWVFLEPNNVYQHYVARDPSIEERIARAQRVFVREGNWAERYAETGRPFTVIPIPPNDRNFTTSALALYTLHNLFPDESIHIAGMDVGKDRRTHVCVGPHRASGECDWMEQMLEAGRTRFLTPEDHERWIAGRGAPPFTVAADLESVVQSKKAATNAFPIVRLSGESGFIRNPRLEVPDGILEEIEMSGVWEFLDPSATVEVAKECWRALKPGGILRIVTPDLDLLPKLLERETGLPISGDDGGVADFVRTYLDRWMPETSIYAPSLVVNHLMTSRGFTFVWDRGLLLEILNESGFDQFYSETPCAAIENMGIIAVKQTI